MPSRREASVSSASSARRPPASPPPSGSCRRRPGAVPGPGLRDRRRAARVTVHAGFHLHMLFVDGVYTFDDERGPACTVAAPRHRPNSSACSTPSPSASPAPSRNKDCCSVTTTPPSLDLEPADGFEQLLGAAVHYRIATGPHTGRKALTLRTVASNPLADNPCIAQLSGFSLHSVWAPRNPAPPITDHLLTAPTGAPRGHAAPHLRPAAHPLPDTLPSLPAVQNLVTSTAKPLRSHRQRTRQRPRFLDHTVTPPTTQIGGLFCLFFCSASSSSPSMNARSSACRRAHSRVVNSPSRPP